MCMRLAALVSLGLDMLDRIKFACIAVGFAIFPLSEAIACSWDNLGVGYPPECGYRPPGGGYRAPPVHHAPPVRRPSPRELQQRQSVAFNKKGIAQFNHKNYAAAIKLFETAAKLATDAHSARINRQNIGGAYSWLGKAAFDRGDTAEALRLYELAAQYYPGNKAFNEAVANLRQQIVGRQHSKRIVDALSESITAAPANSGLDVGSFETKSTTKPAALGFDSFGPGNSQSNTGQKNAVPPAPVAVVNKPKCEGTFCIKDNPKNAGGAPIQPGQKQTKYDSAGAQLDAAAKAKEASEKAKEAPEKAKEAIGCVFDGQAGCATGEALAYPHASGGGRGSASLSPAIRQAMARSPEGKQMFADETALRSEYASAEAKTAALKAKRDAASGPARGQLAVDYANADKLRTDIGQKLYVKEIAIEDKAKQYKLDKDK